MHRITPKRSTSRSKKEKDKINVASYFLSNKSIILLLSMDGKKKLITLSVRSSTT